MANIIGTKIILIHPGQTHGHLSKFIIDEFTPHTDFSNNQVFFMTFLEPHYYHVTESLYDAPIHTVQLRENFAVSHFDRKRLRKKAIATISKGHATKIDAIIKPEQPETITITNRRFDVTPITPNKNFSNQNFTPRNFNLMSNKSESYSYSSSSESIDEHDRFRVKTIYDEQSNPKNLNSMFKIKQHIQLTIGKMDSFDRFKQFNSDDEASSDSSVSNNP